VAMAASLAVTLDTAQVGVPTSAQVRIRDKRVRKRASGRI
jgi:hypothetical protein